MKDSGAGYANIRNAPNLSGSVIGKLKSGATAYPGDSVADKRSVVWMKIRKTRRGKFLGWISIVISSAPVNGSD